MATIINIFASPREAFTAIKERPTFLVPLLLICFAAAAVNWLYLAEVDIGWLTEQQLRAISFILAQTAINPLSLANLGQIDLSNASSLVSAAMSISPINIWSLVLLIMGYKAISKSSLGIATSVVLIPIALIVAIVLTLI